MANNNKPKCFKLYENTDIYTHINFLYIFLHNSHHIYLRLATWRFTNKQMLIRIIIYLDFLSFAKDFLYLSKTTLTLTQTEWKTKRTEKERTDWLRIKWSYSVGRSVDENGWNKAIIFNSKWRNIPLVLLETVELCTRLNCNESIASVCSWFRCWISLVLNGS